MCFFNILSGYKSIVFVEIYLEETRSRYFTNKKRWKKWHVYNLCDNDYNNLNLARIQIKSSRCLRSSKAAYRIVLGWQRRKTDRCKFRRLRVDWGCSLVVWWSIYNFGFLRHSRYHRNNDNKLLLNFSRYGLR